MERDARDIPVPVRFSATEREMLRRAAESEHMFVSSYLRRVAMEAAERKLKAAGEPVKENG